MNEWMNKSRFFVFPLWSELTKARSPPNELTKFVRSPTNGTKRKTYILSLAPLSLSNLLFSAHFGFLVAVVAAKAARWFYSQQPSFGASSPSGAQFASLSLSLFLCIFMDCIFCVGYSEVSMMMMMPPMILFLLDVKHLSMS
jgi:hypothetical protein